MVKVVFSLVLAAALLGCAGWLDRVQEPEVIGDVVRNAPTVVGNPGNVDAWIEIAKAVGYVVLGAGGKAGVDTMRKRRPA